MKTGLWLVGLQANEPEGLAWDTFRHVYELVQNGNEAFRENRMEKVTITFYCANNLFCCSVACSFELISVSTEGGSIRD